MAGGRRRCDRAGCGEVPAAHGDPMRARAVAIGLALGIAIGIVAVATGEARPITVSRLFVSAKEWSLISSRQAMKPGAVRIQLYNAGEDAHDLRLRRVGGAKTLAVGETAPGDVTEI